jgi:hypothetical protein
MATLAPSSLAQLSDRDLLDQLGQAADNERGATARLIVLLQEVEARRLYLALGYSSLYTYCTRVLHLSESAAYRRIEVARLARRFPIVLELLESGSVTLEVLHVLNPHLTTANHGALLEQAQHRSRSDVEHMVATLCPRDDVPTAIAQLATPPSHTAPLAPDRYEVQCTISGEAYQQLRELQDLMRHTVPDGDIGPILERAITVLLDEVSRVRKGAVKHPRPSEPGDGSTRYIRRSVRRAVWAKCNGRCAYVGTEGRCNVGGRLEVHHVIPFSEGGRSDVDNLELRCRAHNAYEADSRAGTFHNVDGNTPKPP